MKYITKRIYNSMQRSDMHLLLKCSNKATKYSEELFHKQYKKEENKRIKQMQGL